jgi:hypothetical protein
LPIPSLSTLLLCALVPTASPQTSDGCGCRATNARYNIVNQPKTGYDYIPIVDDDSLGFYVAYSAKQNDTNTDFISTSCMYVLPLDNDEILIFGGGFGDTWYLPGGAFFDADYDVAMIKDAVVGCMGRDLATTHVRFLAPHGHPDHITVAFMRALERAGFQLSEITYHEGDRGWIEQLPWQAHHPALFHVLPTLGCNEELASYTSPLGRLWVVGRPGHTPGSIDLVLDVLGNPANRILIQGSVGGGCPPPDGVVLSLAAHGTALIGGPRRAQLEVLAGQGTNRACLTSITPPRLGTTWVVALEIASHPGANYVFLFGSDCRYEPGLTTPYGELLVNPLGRYPFAFLRPVVTSDKEFIGMDLPRDPALMGRTVFVQGSVLGGGIELCNALKVVIGF